MYYIPLSSRSIPFARAPPQCVSRCILSGTPQPDRTNPGEPPVGLCRRKPGDEFPSPITSIFHTDRRPSSTAPWNLRPGFRCISAQRSSDSGIGRRELIPESRRSSSRVPRRGAGGDPYPMRAPFRDRRDRDTEGLKRDRGGQREGWKKGEDA